MTAPNCLGWWDVYDTLIDHESGAAWRVARQEALELCNACPIKLTCWPDNADEPWMKAIRRTEKHPPTTRPSCGTRNGAGFHYRNGEDTCDACKGAIRRRSAEMAAAKKRRREPEPGKARCGTDSGYHHHRKQLKEPACDLCRTAHSAAEVTRAKRKRDAA